jgi:hypothetical protein
MKKQKIIYWIATGALLLFILPGAFSINSELAKEGTRHLGFPDFFRLEVGIGTILGGLILLFPFPKFLKEWNYVALGIVYISAFIAHLSVDGLVLMSFAPVATFAALVVSYVYYHKLHA